MRYSNRAAFAKSLKSAAPNLFSHVYLIGIADDYERSQAFDAILRYLATPDRLIQRFSGVDLNLKEVFNHLQTASLFGGEPIVCIDELEKAAKKVQQELFAEPITFGYLIAGTRSKTGLSAAAEKHGIVLDLLDEKPWEKEKRLQEQFESKVRNAGKSARAEVIHLLFERLDKDSATFDSEVDKLIAYIGDRSQILPEDVMAISTANRTYTFWQTAEELIWEGRELGPMDDTTFHGLIPALRSQLQLGLKIASLLEQNAPRDEWAGVLPKVFPKTLEKRTPQAAKLGSSYFQRGLQTLFDIELKSRTGSQQHGALLDFFRAKIHVHGR